jgi:26S proteasome regulatory subunit N3
MQNKEVLDVYVTEEPLLAFDERIRFCLSLHDEAIKVPPPPLPGFPTRRFADFRL